MSHKDYDYEGRVMRVDFETYSIISVYMPSGSSSEVRQAIKMQFLADFLTYCKRLLVDNPKLIVVGDYNICHKAIDIHDPVRNAKSSGFLPEERAWLDDFFGEYFMDTFRFFNKEPHHYSWWSYRARSRERNKGWRIDYQAVSKALQPQLLAASILPDVKHSDHCPIYLAINRL